MKRRKHVITILATEQHVVQPGRDTAMYLEKFEIRKYVFKLPVTSDLGTSIICISWPSCQQTVFGTKRVVSTNVFKYVKMLRRTDKSSMGWCSSKLFPSMPKLRSTSVHRCQRAWRTWCKPFFRPFDYRLLCDHLQTLPVSTGAASCDLVWRETA